MNRKIITIAVSCIVALGAITGFFFLAPASNQSETAYLYIDNDDNQDSIQAKLSGIANGYSITAFNVLANLTGMYDHLRTGRYELDSSTSTLQFFRHVRNGQQTPVMLTIPSVRTKGRLAEEIGKHLLMDSDELLDSLSDQHVCQRIGYDTTTIVDIFIPNTYEVYWNTSVDKLLAKMKTESDRFWNDERKQKANALELTENDVLTLASIIDEETANNGEKPMIAGMYYNRLKINMPLQADPTVKFAHQDFELRRIYQKLLTIDSPYNTYKYAGLPPGPIRIPSIAGIDAVLNLVHHDYIYMCAKEDFSGTHNFAVTYKEHLQNAARYTAALNQRGIK